MDIQDGFFSELMIENCGIGAGIIPIAVDNNNNIRILLAKERYVQQWKGSYRWSGFEGSKKENESIIDTAIRELDEEGLGIITFDKPIKELLQKKKYVMRIVINIYQDRPTTRYHSTFLVKVNWNSKWVEDFRLMRTRLMNLKTLGDELCSLTSRPMKIKIGDTCNDDYFKGNIITIKNVEEYGDEEMIVIFDVTHERELHTHRIKTKLCNNLLSWFNKRLEIQNALFEHNSLDVTYDKCDLVLSLSVKDDYMEKERIQWWGLDELQDVIQSKGQYFSEQFRPYFMPVLQTFVQECTNCCSLSNEFPLQICKPCNTVDDTKESNDIDTYAKNAHTWSFDTTTAVLQS